MRKAPLIFIFVLALVLIFIIGFRSGQQVEKTNEAIDFVLSITPSPTSLPSPSPTPVKYQDYKSKRWGLKFTYPEGLEVKEDATSPAVLFKMK